MLVSHHLLKGVRRKHLEIAICFCCHWFPYPCVGLVGFHYAGARILMVYLSFFYMSLVWDMFEHSLPWSLIDCGLSAWTGTLGFFELQKKDSHFWILCFRSRFLTYEQVQLCARNWLCTGRANYSSFLETSFFNLLKSYVVPCSHWTLQWQ